MRSKQHAQSELMFRTHGGRRKGAGRKAKGDRPAVSHARRPVLEGRFPVLITLKVRRGIWNLRRKGAFNRIWHALRVAKARFAVRFVHFSVQGDHIHLIAEARNAAVLSKAMKGLAVRIARALNRWMARTGSVFADRYHERVLTSPKQTRHALAYTLGNAKKHGIGTDAPTGWVDAMSSAPFFDGWCRSVHFEPAAWTGADPPISAPETFFLREGWRRAGGLLDPDHRPGPPARAS